MLYARPGANSTIAPGTSFIIPFGFFSFKPSSGGKADLGISKLSKVPPRPLGFSSSFDVGDHGIGYYFANNHLAINKTRLAGMRSREIEKCNEKELRYGFEL